MIERYTLPEMGRVWSEAHKYELWCRVELLVLEAHARAGTVPAESVEPGPFGPIPTPEAVAAVEAVTDHDVIAFLTAWADNTEPRSAAAWVHYGMTSSDLLDTALAVQLAEATDLLIAKADPAGRGAAGPRAGAPGHAAAGPDARRPRRAGCLGAPGRPTSPSPWRAAADRLVRAREAVAVGTLSGPVGSYSNIDPAIEAEVHARARAAGRRRGHPGGDAGRDRRVGERAGHGRHRVRGGRAGGQARAADRGAGAGRAVRPGQKGSSAMPHKKNPIRSERICGLARVVRGYVTPVTEGIPLWHERDISHSSVERIALPDASIATDYLLNLTAGLIEGLTVDVARMRANLELTGGLMYSAAVLLELVSAGMRREDAYALVQAAAMDTWDNGTPFRDTLRKQAATRGLSLPEQAIDLAFRPEQYSARLGPVFERLAGLS